MARMAQSVEHWSYTLISGSLVRALRWTTIFFGRVDFDPGRHNAFVFFCRGLPSCFLFCFDFPVREKVLAGLGSRCPSSFKGPSSFALSRDLTLRGGWVDFPVREKVSAGLGSRCPSSFKGPSSFALGRHLTLRGG